jgi:hypothetical protein
MQISNAATYTMTSSMQNLKNIIRWVWTMVLLPLDACTCAATYASALQAQAGAGSVETSFGVGDISGRKAGSGQRFCYRLPGQSITCIAMDVACNS